MTQASINMPSSISFTNSITSKTSSQSIYTRPQKKQKMSITQTYFLAHSARGKLSKEAARADHDLRLLVGHANMLDSLMLDLANAEQEQERWFNKSINESREEEEEPAHSHVETIEEDEDEEESIQIAEVEVESDMEEDDEDDEELALTRTPSRHSPPALSQDSDSESDDEIPPSPPQPTMEILSEKQRQAIATTSFYDTKDIAMISPVESEAFEQEGFYLPSRQQPIQIAAY